MQGVFWARVATRNADSISRNKMWSRSTELIMCCLIFSRARSIFMGFVTNRQRMPFNLLRQCGVATSMQPKPSKQLINGPLPGKPSWPRWSKKWVQVQQFREKLRLVNRNALLPESTYNETWGTRLNKTGTENTKQQTWPGKTLLGQILNEIAKTHVSAKRVINGAVHNRSWI